MCSPELPPGVGEKHAATIAKSKLTRERNKARKQQQTGTVHNCSSTSLKRPRTAAGAASRAVVQRALRDQRARICSKTAAVEASLKPLQSGSVRQTDDAAATAEAGAQQVSIWCLGACQPMDTVVFASVVPAMH